jgi:stage II sporulation protein D
MKRIAIMALVLTLLVFLLPLIAVRGKPLAENVYPDQSSSDAIEAAGPAVVEEIGDAETEDGAEPASSPAAAAETTPNEEPEKNDGYKKDSEVQVRVEIDGSVKIMSLHKYLLGVVSAEMPASFPIEALKAQAVAARTFTYSRMDAVKAGHAAHENADVCTESSHCKAYISWEKIKLKWDAIGRSDYAEKITDAVESTDGEVMFYNDEPIVAVFHAASGAYTENAKDVWGSDIPYLQSVKSPDGAEYSKKVTFSADEFKSRFTEKYPDAVFTGDLSGWVMDINTSDAGGVIGITIGGVRVSGRTVRTLYGLASANFEIVTGRDKVTFFSSGFGHCVGMSQYGAQALALGGKDYREILSWYYTDIDIKK